jgi:hypothetical protein
VAPAACGWWRRPCTGDAAPAPAAAWWRAPPGGAADVGPAAAVDLGDPQRLALALLAARPSVIEHGATAALDDAGITDTVRGASAETLALAVVELARARQQGSAYAHAFRAYANFAAAKAFAVTPVTPAKLDAFLLYRAAGHAGERGARAGQLLKSSGLNATLNELRVYFRSEPACDWAATDDEYETLQRHVHHLQYAVPSTLDSSPPVELDAISTALAHLRQAPPTWSGRRLAAWIAASIGWGLRGEEALAAVTSEVTLTDRGAGFAPHNAKSHGATYGVEGRRAAPHLPHSLRLLCVSAALVALHGPSLGAPSAAATGRPLFPLAETGPGALTPWPVSAALGELRALLTAVGRPATRVDAHWGRASTGGLYFHALHLDYELRNAMGAWALEKKGTVRKHYMTMTLRQLLTTAHTAVLAAVGDGEGHVQCCTDAASAAARY